MRQAVRREQKEESMKRLLLVIAVCFAISGVALAAVNINTATKEELTSIKGIGEKRAQDIIDYRTKNGPFKSVDDLEKVPGIGPGLMKQIRSQVTVSGKTTVDKPAKGETKSKAGDSAKTTKSDTKKAAPAKSETVKKDTKEKTAGKSPSEEKATAK
jgi:competence protein ComEA